MYRPISVLYLCACTHFAKLYIYMCVCVNVWAPLPGVKISPPSHGGGSSRAECRGFRNCYGYPMDTTCVTYVTLNALLVLLLSLNLNIGYISTHDVYKLFRQTALNRWQTKAKNVLSCKDYLFIEIITALWSNNCSIGFDIEFGTTYMLFPHHGYHMVFLTDIKYHNIYK